MKKKGDFGFVWLFAIIAGGTIFFLAIYGAFQFGDMKRFQTDTEIAAKISVLTDPMQAGFAEGKSTKISFSQATRIVNNCFDADLGRNEISVATSSYVGQKWNNPGAAISVHNKYVFSSGMDEGKDFFIFSKPFDFPYKIADLIFLTTENYCFLNAPDEIKNEISSLQIPNIKFENCSADDKKVCFGAGNDCDIHVYGSCTDFCNSIYDEGTVEKNGKEMKFAGNLIYAAIFSDPEIYQCNVKRLLVRDSDLAGILKDKIDLMSARECNSNLAPDLILWKSLLENSTSENVISLNQASKSLQQKNSMENCNLW